MHRHQLPASPEYATGRRVTFRPLPIDYPRQRRPDIALTQSILKWQPTIPLEAELQKTIDYFRKLLDTKPRPLFCKHRVPSERYLLLQA